jgi:hypothetical protein
MWKGFLYVPFVYVLEAVWKSIWQSVSQRSSLMILAMVFAMVLACTGVATLIFSYKNPNKRRSGVKLSFFRRSESYAHLMSHFIQRTQGNLRSHILDWV